VLIGPDDRERNEVQLKDLAAKAQRSVSRTDAVAAIVATRT
jgi:histidyl-tRNA synthetase